jgi:hypothetical protein
MLSGNSQYRKTHEKYTVLETRERIMKYRVIAFSLVALPLGARAYDIEAYCQQVGAAAGGGAQLEAACRAQERTAKDNIGRMSVPSGILKYCRQVGQSAGGSYQFMEACIKEESRVKDKLD